MEEFLYDFGDVGIGTHKTHNLVVYNPTSVHQNFVIELNKNRRSHAEPACFTIKPLIIYGLESNKKSTFKLKYCPLIPNRESRFQFRINRSDGFYINGKLIGNCLGPYLETSNNKITFKCSTKDQTEQKHFKLTNKGIVPATFNFDVSNSSRLTVEPLHGCVEPKDKLRVVVTFTARNQTMMQYLRILTCHVLHSNPVKITIINLSDKDKETLVSPSTVFMPSNVSLSDDRILSNNTGSQLVHYSGPLSITESFIDFESCINDGRIVKQITIHNSSDYESTILWDKDGSDSFQMLKRINIKPKSSQEMRITFAPTKKDHIHFSKLTGSILCKSHLLLTNMNINIIGHSFDRRNCFWPALYTIEPEFVNRSQNCSVLLLPPALLHSANRSSFLIRRHGILPLSFIIKQAPHTCSNFRVIPMQGIIHGPYYIIMVELIVEDILQHTFKQEKWSIEFNCGSIKHELILQVHIEQPNLIVNGNTAVHFPTTHPQCIQSYLVSVSNPTHKHLKFTMRLTMGGDVLRLNNTEYEVKSNDMIFVEWIFNPPAPGSYSGEVYFMYCEIEYARFNFPIQVYGECEMGYLKTLPESFSMGHIVLGNWENSVFKVVNESNACVNVTLNCQPCTLMSVMKGVLMEPDKFTVNPGESVQVEVSAIPGGLYQHDLQISYRFRLREDSDEFVGDVDWIPLIRFNLIGVYPIFKVVDIQCTTLKYLTKYNVWNIIDVNRLNEIFKNLYYGNEEQAVEIFLPSEMESSTSIFKLMLMVRNESSVSADWNIVQNKTCNCKPQEQQIGMNTFQMVSFCQHKQQITLNPKSGQLQGDSCVLLTILVTYKLIGEERQIFVLKVNPERMPWLSNQLTLTFVRYAIPLGTPMLTPCLPLKYDSLETLYKFMAVFIGQQKSFLQGFWMYNSTNLPVQYEVKTQCVQNKAFFCVNPKGIVKPLRSHHLLFTFVPNELNVYKACFCVVVNGEELFIDVECESICSFPQMLIYQMYNKMPPVSLFTNTSKVQLTCDHILFPLVPLHSSAEKIFYFNNFTEHEVIARWESVRLKGILYMKVLPEEFQLGPYQCVVLTVKCKTAGQPCLLSSDLICHVKVMRTTSTDSSQIIDQQCRNAKDIIQKQIIGVTVTVHANTTNHLLLKNCLKYRFGSEVLQRKKLKHILQPRTLSRERADMIIKIFDGVLWKISSSPHLEHCMRQYSPIYYKEFLPNLNVKASTKNIVRRWNSFIVDEECMNGQINKSDLPFSNRIAQLEEFKEENEIYIEESTNEEVEIEEEEDGIQKKSYFKCQFTENASCPLEVKEQILSNVVNELLFDCYIKKLFHPTCN